MAGGTDPKFGGALTKFLVSSQVAQEHALQAVWASGSFADLRN